MRIENDLKLNFDNVLLRPKRSSLSSRKDVQLEREIRFKHSPHMFKGIPIMAANMDGVGTVDMAKKLQTFNVFTCLVKNYTVDDLRKHIDGLNTDLFAVSTGINDHDYENFSEIMQAFPDIKYVCIDVANGYSERFGAFVSKIRTTYPDKVIIAGNVVTADMTQELILNGADVVKVGIGPGSVCTTRLQTGVGYPQLSAVIECADAAHGLGARIISDGGCVVPGDIAKAFGGNADFVMLGGMLAGHPEGGGTLIEKEVFTDEVAYERDQTTDTVRKVPKTRTEKYVEFYGMSSDTAMEKHKGGVAPYRSSEGRTVRVPFKPSLETTVKDILGGLRSACTYIGARRLREFSKCTTFIKVSKQYNDVFED
ncbi:MAG: GMP reductase [Candidatus Izemoplasmataceae bacterium]